MPVYETGLPGVGRKSDFELETGGLASAVLHHDGRCEFAAGTDWSPSASTRSMWRPRR